MWTFLLIAVVVAIVIIAQPAVWRMARRLPARQLSRARSRVGVQTGSRIARDVLLEAKAKAQVMLKHTWLPNRVVVSLSPSEYDSLGPARDQLARDVKSLIEDSAKPNAQTREPSHYYVADDVQVSVRRDPTVTPGTYPVEAWLEPISESDGGVATATQTALDPTESYAGLFLEVVETSDETRRLYPLTQGEHVLGRASSADVRLPASTVSGAHARFVVAGLQDVWIEDLDSRNGTFLDGRRIEQRVLVFPGQRVRLGSRTEVLITEQP